MQSPLPSNVRQLGMWCHLAGLAWIPLLVVPIPYLWLLVPYLVWARNKTVHPFVDEQGKEALNFQLSIAVYLTALLILGMFLFFVTCGVALTMPNQADSIFSLAAIAIGAAAAIVLIPQIILVILAASKAANGQSYRYPLTLRFLS